MAEIKTLTVNGKTYTVADPDAAHIDDSSVGEKAWSSAQIAKTAANALKGAATGNPVCITDCSPVEHELAVTLSSATVKDFSEVKVRKYPSKNYAPYEMVEVSKVDTGTFVFAKPLQIGKTYRFTADIESTFETGVVLTLQPSGTQLFLTTGIGKTITFTVPAKGCTNIWLFAATSYGASEGHTATYSRISVIEECAPAEHIPNYDGTVNGIIGNGEPMTLITDDPDTTITAQYNRDTNKVVESLVNAIVSLGGSV